jgi:hypothetical protein
MALVNSVDKRIAKAALGLLVATRGIPPVWAADGVAEVAARIGLQLGDLGNLTALTAYASGVQEKGERVSNRRGTQYPQPIAQAARKLADSAVAAIEAELGV